MMKRMLLVLALLALSAASALAQGSSHMGMYADQALSACVANNGLYATTSVYFYAVLDGTAVPSISAVQFKVDNLPAAGANGLVTSTWNTTLVIGEPGTDLALAFNPPLAAPEAYLGKIDFFTLNAVWIGSDHVLAIVPANSQTDVLIVRFSDAAELPVPGDLFTFNCTGDCPCTTAVEPTSWGSIKALY